ncbi:MAG TPA: hypothetical protein VL282_10535 [Tepidisphaeraceae bacterium]|jgi:hypothetical protein|nr:hypothetical protein [Tepidisphaeraceae bacterium]
MIELVDTLPDINVQPAEYKRLLGYPRDRVLDGRARELTEWARSWYANNGRPWVYAREAKSLELINGSILIDGVSFSSPRLQKTLAEAEAHSVILAAVSAGPELEAESHRLWLEEKPDDYFFLDIFGSAVVEHLTTMTGARLCGWAESRKMAVLPHYSPGYPEWEIDQQPRLLELLRHTDHQPLPGQIESLTSGMLRPKKSLIGVFGITNHTEKVRKLTDLVPCENCSLSNCQFRRVPYRRAPEFSKTEAISLAEEPEVESIETAPPRRVQLVTLERKAKYAVNNKALGRWANDRLTMKTNDDGTIDAVFRYEGSTCSNMGRTIRFVYHVKLGPREDGYPIREMTCGPAPGDDGHRYMCRYMSNAEHLMVAIDHEKPLLGQPLNDVLAWQRPEMAPSCYCEPSSRKHKWGIVLETIHYALVQQETKPAEEAVTAR